MGFLRSLFGKKEVQHESAQKLESRTIAWRDSRAHLLLLSKYKNPLDEGRYAGYADWEDALGEPVAHAVSRLKQDQVLRSANLNEKLTSYTVAELKEILRTRDLPVSGNKAVLISRLVDADPIGMQSITNNLRFLTLTPNGTAAVQAFEAMAEQERTKAEQESFDALCRHDFRRASLVMAEYEAKQVFSRGIGINWNDYNPEGAVNSLKVMFTGWPVILRDVPEQLREHYRIAAGMGELYGSNRSGTKWLPDGVSSGTRYADFWICNMLSTYKAFVTSRERYSRSEYVLKVQSRHANDNHVCPECEQLSHKSFTLDEMPELPYKSCTCELGCRCGLGIAEMRD